MNVRVLLETIKVAIVQNEIKLHPFVGISETYLNVRGNSHSKIMTLSISQAMSLSVVAITEETKKIEQ